jgi:hypothetical protein
MRLPSAGIAHTVRLMARSWSTTTARTERFPRRRVWRFECLAASPRARLRPALVSPHEVTTYPVPPPFCRSSRRRCRRPSWRGVRPGPLLRAHPRPVRVPGTPEVHVVREQRPRSLDRDPARTRRAAHPPARRAGADAFFGGHDDAGRARVIRCAHTTRPSPPTLRCRRGCRRFTVTSLAPKLRIGASGSHLFRSLRPPRAA